MYLKKWIVNENNDWSSNNNLNRFSKIVKSVLQNRGFTNIKQINKFLNADVCVDPFELKDMDKAVDRIKMAIDNEEKIVIYGDYDVDGITSTVVLFSYLSSIGANVDFYIPLRDSEGYGLNVKSINQLSEDCQLIITVDNGITAIDEIDYANNLGLDVVVTDHHTPLETLPNAIAVVDPHRKDCNSGCENLAGVGVVYKLVSALSGSEQEILNKYADIIGLGTIADVVPLQGENRFIVKKGMQKLQTNPNKCIKKLMQASNLNSSTISAIDISYKMAPKLNSASRLGKVMLTVEALLSNDDEKIDAIVTELENINVERKKIEEGIMKDINQMIEDDPSILKEDIIILAKEGWNHSVSGINASKIVEKFNKPCIIITIEGDVCKASGRGVEGLSLINAIDYCKDDLLKYGGHTIAVGFTIKTENIQKFSKHIREYIKGFGKLLNIKQYHIDCEINTCDITLSNVKDLELLEPYGFGNTSPLILVKDLFIKNIMSLSEGKYVKLIVEDSQKRCFTFLDFNTKYKDFIYYIGQKVDVLISLKVNSFKNKENVMVILHDIRASDFNQEEYFNDVITYSKFRNNEQFDEKLLKSNLPERREVAIIYKYLKTLANYSWFTQHDLGEYLFIKLSQYKFSYIKISVILDILQELNLILIIPNIKLIQTEKKLSIEDAPTYKKILAFT